MPFVVVHGRRGGSAMAANGPRIEPLPSTGLLRVQSADGSVVYMSTDRRFIFRGEMTDLWTGADTAQGLPSNQVDLDRNGVSIDRISLALGSGPQPITAFVSPEFGTHPLERVLRAVRADNWLHAHGRPADPGEALTQAVMAGGDSASRAMAVGMVLGAHLGTNAFPGKWLGGINRAPEILALLGKMS